MAVKHIFPNTLGCNGIDGNRRHAEATEQAQAAWDRTLAANARNEREADARRRSINTPDEVASRGCVFAKSCTLPYGTINYISPGGAIPTDPVSQYGEFALLGGRETDAQGNIPLKKISGSVPSSLGTLLLGALLLAPQAVCLVVVCVRLVLWRPGPPRVLLRVFWWEWLHCCGHPAWATAAYIPKNSSRRLKRDVYVFACTLSSRPTAP